jgi:hypothetical protein
MSRNDRITIAILLGCLLWAALEGCSIPWWVWGY